MISMTIRMTFGLGVCERMNDIKSIIEDVNKSEIVSKKVIEKIMEMIGQEEWHDLYDEYNDTVTTTGEVVITLRSLDQENNLLRAQNEKMLNLP